MLHNKHTHIHNRQTHARTQGPTQTHTHTHTHMQTNDAQTCFDLWIENPVAFSKITMMLTAVKSSSYVQLTIYYYLQLFTGKQCMCYLQSSTVFLLRHRLQRFMISTTSKDTLPSPHMFCMHQATQMHMYM